MTTTAALPSLLTLNLQLILHEEHMVKMNDIRLELVYSLIKLPYFIKLASAETLGQITHTL